MLDRTKKIVFLTGTRADFGKLKSLIDITSQSSDFEVYIFVTGMHLQELYGMTIVEIERCGYKHITKYSNYTSESSMDQTLARTIEGFSDYVRKLKPDLIIIHGDRIEAMAGAITGALNNILICHIEGGEVSGTIDELIRHAISKLSHTHFVSNEKARKRLIQMGELPNNIFVIGSPDIDTMLSPNLPSIKDAKNHYGIRFEEYAIALFHPVTSEIDWLPLYAKEFTDALIESDHNYVVIYPNNDLGSSIILQEFDRMKGRDNFRIYPSIRFEYFLTLLKHSRFIIGNSSAGIREAPYYGLPTINIGTRQHNRALHNDILHTDYSKSEILIAIKKAKKIKHDKTTFFGCGNSGKLFYKILNKSSFWEIDKQKQFNDVELRDK